MKTSNLLEDNCKKILDVDGSTPEPEIRSGDASQLIPCFDSNNIDVQYVCNRKCEVEHWFPCGADGRSEAVGVRSRDYQIFWDG